MWRAERNKEGWRAHLHVRSSNADFHVRGPTRRSRDACDVDIATLETKTRGHQGNVVVAARVAVAELRLASANVPPIPDWETAAQVLDQRKIVQQLALLAMGAMSRGQEEDALSAISAFLVHLAPLDDCYDGKNTLLTQAICTGSLATVSFLLDHGADPDAPRSDGACPLHLAAGAGRADLMNELIQWGANVSQTIDGQITPLQEVLRLAPSKAIHECRELLLLSGHCETAEERRAWRRRVAADAAASAQSVVRRVLEP
jgi:hypothetical protein